MCASFVISTLFTLYGNKFGLDPWQTMIISVALTTACWLPLAWIGQGTKMETEESFRLQANPGGIWRENGKTLEFKHPKQSIKWGMLSALFATLAIYSALFSAGNFIYNRSWYGWGELAGCIIFTLLTYRSWKRSFASCK